MVDKNKRKANRRLKRIGVLIFCMIVAVATALACVFCIAPGKKVGVDDVDSGEVRTSTAATYSTAGTYNFTTGSGNIANNAAGRLVNGDVLTFNYVGAIYGLILPKGEYKLEVWGAQGGTVSSSYAGGQGGYAVGTYMATASPTTLYVCVGGTGTTSGNGGGGGGATHIATMDGQLSSIGETNKSKVLIVGGGGGGAGQSTAGGAGGGTTGGTGGGGAGGGGGTQTGPGSVGTYTSSNSRALQGTFGKGGIGLFADTQDNPGKGGYNGGANAGPSNGYGGGGGGLWGGSGGSFPGSAGGGGGGGSGYTGGVTGGNMTNGTQPGNGKAVITVVNVNQDPRVTAYTVPGNQVLGTLGTPISIVASSLAVDDQDGSEQTAAQKYVYFANGPSDMTFTANNTTNLYVDAACTTKLSSDYFDYKFINNTTLQITNFKKLPRAGTAGYNIANNTLTVYAVLRDNYNATTLSQCGKCITPITINFAKLSISHGNNTAGIASGTNKYRFGDNSTMNSSTVSSGGIYSKTQAGRFALTVEKPIKRGDAVTITAKELLAGYDDTKYRVLIALPNSVTAGSPYSITTNAADKVTFSDWNGTSATDTNATYTGRDGYTKITINGLNANRDWQSYNVMLYLVETSTNQEPAQITYTGGTAANKQELELNFKCDNTRPVLRTTPINGKPAIINVPLGQKVDVNLNDYFKDQDDGDTISASTHSVQKVEVPQYEFVQVDKYGNVLSTVNTAGASGDKSYYNIGGSLSGTLASGKSDTPTNFKTNIASTTADPNAFVMYSYTGITVSLTGLRSSYSQYDASRKSKTARTGGNTSAATGAAPVDNPGHFYLLIQIRDNNEVDDTGIYLPIAITVGAGLDENAKPKSTGTALHSQSGQGTPPSTLPTADGDPTNIFRFTPMAVNIGGTLQPIGSYLDGNVLSQKDLKPLAVDADNFAVASGVSTWSGKLNELLMINADLSDEAKRTEYIESLYRGIGTGSKQYVDISLIDIYIPQSYFGGRVSTSNPDPNAKIPGVNYVPSLVPETAGGVACYKIYGLQIQLKSTTMNRFIHAFVDIADSSVASYPTSRVTVDIAIRVSNKAPQVLDSSKIVTTSDITFGTTASVSGADIPTITYKVPAHSTFMITPYDLIYDPDMYIENGELTMSPRGGFTLNGLNGVYDKGAFIQGGKTSDSGMSKDAIEVKALLDTVAYGTGNTAYITALKSMISAADAKREIERTTLTNTFADAATGSADMFNDKLFFVRSDYNSFGDAYTFDPITNGSLNFYIDSRNTDGYLEWVFGNSISINETKSNMDFILIQAKSRTTIAAEIDLIVRDRYGVAANGVGTQIKIVIEVVNTAPALKNNPPFELSAKPVTVKDDTGEHIVTPSELAVMVDSIMEDRDTDPISYMTGNGILIANTPMLKTLYPGMTSFDVVDSKYLVDNNDVDNPLPLTQYVSAEFSGLNIVVKAFNSTKNISGGVYVYFFATDKKENGETLGYIQVEVLNSVMEMNRTETGFDAETNLWKVLSTSGADITRSRYIVGSEKAYDATSQLGAVPADIKLIATDTDSLQRGVMLSPRGASDYINLLNTDYDYAVPKFTAENTVGIPHSGNEPFAVAAYMTTADGGKEVVPTNFTIELNFYVDETWYTRDQLVDALEKGSVAKELCFDDLGRWIVIDWAIRLQATEPFDTGDVLAIEISLRDEAYYGGDTAGLGTAYNTDRKLGQIDVNGKLSKDPIVFLSISGTGISTKDMYAQYNNYYVVEVDKKVGNTTETTAYISTYDGKTDSVYEAADKATRIAYDTVSGKNILNSNGANEIKAVTGADGTKAGTNSGTKFDSSAKYDARAYQYPDRIVVPGTTDPNTLSNSVVYVPMSFFGMLKTFVNPSSTDGSVTYLPDYVGYDVRKNGVDASYDKGKIEDIWYALTLTDSKGGYWTGANLNDNPYIKIDAVDYTKSMNGATYFGQPNSKAYYNTRIGTNTVDADGYLLGYEKKDSGNLNSFVGNGEVLYLENQATMLKEHNFGLSFVKTNMRTTDDITLTVNLAKSKDGSTTVGEEEEQNARSVSVKIRVENGMFDLVEDSVLNYDANKGTYYVDLTMSSDGAQRYALMRDGHDKDGIENATDDIRNAQWIHYTDTDYDKDNGAAYRDFGYFYYDSFSKVESWNGARTREYIGEGDSSKFVNTALSSSHAQNSMLNYYGEKTAEDAYDVDGKYQPNPGKYGSNNGVADSGMSGYGSYFTAATVGRLITFTAVRKTYINEVALKDIATSAEEGFNFGWDEDAGTYGGLTQKQLSEIYTSRGLVVEYYTASENAAVTDGDIKKVYYPFKVIVYDSAVSDVSGFAEASYTALEFRISIINTTATIKDDLLTIENGKRYYDVLLSVGSSINVNLYNFVNDPDILVMSGEDPTLATHNDFIQQTGVTLETSDYLQSLFAYTPIVDAEGKQEASSDSGTVYKDGLSKTGSKYYDVIMSMPTGMNISVLTAETEPQTNHLRFTVNRRTTIKNGDTITDKTEFEFVVRFCDNHAETDADYTEEIIFRIKISNQTPWVTTDIREVTMRTGDSITLLTSYYDTFIGGAADGTVAYNNSATKQNWSNRENPDIEQTFDIDGDKNNGWNFSKIDSSWADKIVTNTANRSGDGMHLGFIGIGNDDTAWKLRILEYPVGLTYFRVASQNEALVEGKDHATERLPTALTITARSAVERYDFKVVFIDGDGKSQTYTLRITIVSNAPIPLDPTDSNDAEILKSAGLDGVMGSNSYEEGVYRMFVNPYADADVKIEGFGSVKSRHTVRVRTTDVAKDLDTGETERMMFYNGGGFSVDNALIPRDDNTGIYHASYFDIEVDVNEKYFNLTCTGYNPDKEYEALTFSIGDPGDASKFVNITIHVYTVYADLTNETVANYNPGQYEKYLGGSNEVNVKAVDKYNGWGVYEGDETVVGKESVYAFMQFDNLRGNDGNTQSPINDPDVSTVGKQIYAVNLYAFVDDSGDALTPEQLEPLFERDEKSNTFRLKSRSGSAGEGLGEIGDYLIGGVDAANRSISVTSNAIRRLALVRSYVDFSFDQYGTSIMFTPRTATLGANILLYIEVQKPLGSRAAKREDGIIYGGTLFKLHVEDSAPVSVNLDGQSGYNVAVSGTKGDYFKFKIFEDMYTGGALFTDYDDGDSVTVIGFANAASADADYRTALKLALEQDPLLDWNGSKGRAFDIEINNSDVAVRTSDAPKDINAPDYNADRYILEPHTLRILINRRMDKIVSGKYAAEVTFPIILTAKDTTPTSAPAQTIIRITVKNTTLDAVDSYSQFDYDPITHVGSGMGYSFGHDENDPDQYVINASIAPHQSLTIDLTDFIVDKDYVVGKDTDSYRFVHGVTKSPYQYLIDVPITIKHYTNMMFDEGDDLAVVTPVYDGDPSHTTGFTITAASTARAKVATFYLRVIDRAGDENAMIGDYLYKEGVCIKVNVTLLNARPSVIPSMQEKPLTLVGSNNATITYGPFSIGDYVYDENDTDVVGDEASALNPDTYLRISGTGYQPYDTLYSTKSKTPVSGVGTDGVDEEGGNKMSSALFELTPATGGYNQTFTITTRVGFYGVGTFDIVVSDGNSNVRDDTLSVTFSVRVEIVYNPDELPTLNSVTIAACKTTAITIESLIPQIDNVLESDSEVSESAMSMSADQKSTNMFAPSRDYVLINVEVSEEAEPYAEIEHSEDSFSWTLRALKRLTNEPKRIKVTYALKTDPTKTYNNSFLLTVIENKRPELIYGELTFIRYVDETTTDMLMLNTNNTAYLRTDQLLRDPENDVMHFDSVKSQKPSLVSVSLSENKQLIGITFNARGAAQITVSVIDETGEAASRTFLVINNDLPEPGLWMRITSSFEANKVVWAIVIGCIVLLLIILFIVIAVIIKKKHEQEELEALLVSELEIEEQMYKLAGGPSPTGYQSYGYLQSTPGPMPDPGLMLPGSVSIPVMPNELALPPAPDADLNGMAELQQPPQQADAPNAPTDQNGFDGFNM